MSLVIELKNDITYFPQENGSYCGPASARMLIRHFKLVDNSTQLPSQDDLVGQQNSGNIPTNHDWSSFVTKPFNLVYMLNAYGGSDVDMKHRYFEMGTATQRQTAFLRQLRVIAESDTADSVAIIPVHDWGHWVIVSEYAKSTVPGGVTYPSFIGRDPYFPIDDPQHPDTPPVIVGSSSAGTLSISEAGTINIADHKNNFKRKTNYVLVGRGNEVDDPSIVVGRRRFPLDPPSPEPTRKPIPRASAAKVLLQRLYDYGVLPCLSGRYMKGMEPGTPLRVKRLDYPDGDSDYYLIGLQDKVSHHNRMLTRLEVQTGYYLDSLTVTPMRYLLDQEQNNQDLTDFTKARIAIRFGGLSNSLAMEIEAMLNTVNKNLIWFPCEQSHSAFFPFYVLQYQGKTIYIRIDGAVFDRLTPPLLS